MRAAPVLVLAVLAASLAHAAPIQPVNVLHADVEYEGIVSLESALVALVQQEDPNGATLQAVWNLTAESIHVERDEAKSPDTAAVAYTTPPTTTTGDYSNVEAEGAPRGAGYSISTWPLTDAPAPSLTVRASCIRVHADATGQAEADLTVRGGQRQSRTAELGNALQLAACPETTWKMETTGSFLVVLWGWHTNITAQDGKTHDWRSGIDQDDLTPPATVQAPGRVLRQTYLAVHNGTLTLTTPEPDRLATYTAALRGDVDGSASFRDASLLNQHGDLEVQGAMTVASQRFQQHVKTILTGDVAARIEGNAMSLSTVAGVEAAPRGSVLVSIVILGVALGALPLGGAIQRGRAEAWNRRHSNPRTGQGAHLERAEYLLRQGDNRKALWHARRAVREDGADAWAWEIRGRCHHALRQIRRAGRCYEEAYRLLHDEAVERSHRHALAYRISRTYALRRRGDDASAWLSIAANDPVFLARATDEGDFTRVRRHPDFAVLFRGSVEWTAP